MNDRDLLSFVTEVSGDAFLKVEENLGDGFVRLKIGEAERRQAKHDIRGVEDIVVELLRNSRDAHAQRIFVATSREGDTRSLTVLDDGVGVPTGLRELIFEPRVTSKLETMVMDRWGVHGRGMALFSIRQNAISAYVSAGDLHKGTAISVSVDTTTLAEKADQSTWPTVTRDESGGLRVAKGPHNIVRRGVEFALEHPEIDIFYGSPTEILATMVTLARFELDELDLLRSSDLSRLPVWQRPGAAADAEELTETACEIGLPVSERTAHRILAGEVVPLRTLYAVATKAAPQTSISATPDIYRDRRGLKIHSADLDAFATELEKAFDALAERYYLHLRASPRISVGRDEIRVRFEIDKED